MSPAHRRTPVLRGLGLLSLGLAAVVLSGCLTSNAFPVANAKQEPILLAQADAATEGAEPVQDSSPSGAFLAGLQASRDSDLGSAAAFMLETLENDTDNMELLGRTFMLVAAEGRHEDAVRLAGRLLDLPEGNKGLAELVIVVDNLVRGDLGSARQRLEAMGESGLGSVLRPGIGAWMTLGDGDLDAAEAELGPLKERGGFKVLYLLHLALMSEIAAQESRAQALYEQALAESGEPSLRLVRLAGSFFEGTDPQRARDLYGSFLEDSGGSSLIKAIIARMDAGEAPPREVADWRGGVAEFLFNMASLLSQERAQEVALVHLRQALRMRPDFDIARVLLGEILQNQNRGRAAIAAYESVPESSPWSYLTRLRIADQLSDLEEYEEAARVLENLAGAFPDQVDPLARLGDIFRNRERFEEAEKAYDRAFARVGETLNRHWSLYYFRGIVRERQGKWDLAEGDFLKALELEPEQPFVMNYLAYSWVEQKQNLDEAKAMLVRAVELRPEDGYIVDSLGWVYYRLGEYQAGVEQLERAVELRPQDPTINDHLGDAYWRVGRKPEARFQWRRALSLDPEEDQIEIIRKKIREGLPADGNDI